MWDVCLRDVEGVHAEPSSRCRNFGINNTLAAAWLSDTGVMSFLDRGETERALGRRLIGDISAGAMETLPDGLPLGGIHPGRRRRFFLIGHNVPLQRVAWSIFNCALRSNDPSKLARVCL